PTHTYTLSLHDALPISSAPRPAPAKKPGHAFNLAPFGVLSQGFQFFFLQKAVAVLVVLLLQLFPLSAHSLAGGLLLLFIQSAVRSEEHTSELQSPDHLV